MPIGNLLVDIHIGENTARIFSRFTGVVKHRLIEPPDKYQYFKKLKTSVNKFLQSHDSSCRKVCRCKYI